MGSFSSKLIKNNCTDGIHEKDKPKDKIQIPDPRSPTGEIVRTPITIVQENVPDNERCNRPSMMKQRLLKKLKVDPRSPTDGISRTPIFVDSTPIYKSSQVGNVPESPLSIYSNNLSDLSSLTNIMTPSEPSVNVSGFNTRSKDLDYLCSAADNDDVDSDEVVKVEGDERQCRGGAAAAASDIAKTPLTVSSKPSTVEARKILNEILSSKEFEEELSLNSKKQYNKQQKHKNLSIHCDKSEYKATDKRREKLKHRTPLSNITLSSNSPNHITSTKKPYARSKIMSDVGSENMASPNVRQIVEWDKDKTVII